jgi:mono/diheme cytochrome c family protein
MPKLPEPPHSAQEREHAEPSEANRPMPMVVLVITLLTVAFGIGYILLSEPLDHSALGDQRTLADLRPAVARAGQGADGKQVFNANCVACHQASGQGLPGVFPPLDGSEWVIGDERVVANILLHGIEAEITVAGKTYKGSMPAFGHLSDAELAAVASHVRSTWSNKAPPLQAALFAQERTAHPRSKPFASVEELKAVGAKTP